MLYISPLRNAMHAAASRSPGENILRRWIYLTVNSRHECILGVSARSACVRQTSPKQENFIISEFNYLAHMRGAHPGVQGRIRANELYAVGIRHKYAKNMICMSHGHAAHTALLCMSLGGWGASAGKLEGTLCVHFYVCSAVRIYLR